LEGKAMKLPITQINRFYDLWLPLLDFTNQRLRVFSKKQMDCIQEFEDPQSENQLRDALWNNDWILEEFISQNPAKYSPEDLATVSEWRNFKYGDFTLIKVVYGLGIFVSHEEPHEYYSVYPLYSDFKELLSDIPMLVRTAIIPYGNVLVYDGSLASYAIHFGQGIRKMLENGYISAKERGLIRTSFDQDRSLTREEKHSQIEKTNKSILRYFKQHLKNTNHSANIIQRDCTTAEKLSRYLMNLNKRACSLRDVTVDDLRKYLSSNKSQITPSKIVGMKRLAKFLRDTDRVDWDVCEEMLKDLKSIRDG
jgi:hypothetical protein